MYILICLLIGNDRVHGFFYMLSLIILSSFRYLEHQLFNMISNVLDSSMNDFRVYMM